MKWTDEQVKHAKDLRKQEYTMSEIAEIMTEEYAENITRIAVESKLKRERYKENNTETEVLESHEVDNESTLDKLSNLSQASEEEIIKAHGFDPEKFELLAVQSGIWQQGAKDGIRDLVKSSVKVKPRTVVSHTSLEELIKQNTKSYHYTKSATHIVDGDTNLVIPLADIHFGITKFEEIEDKLHEITDIMQNKHYHNIVIENIGDYFHSDKINSTETVSGTILDDVNMVNAINDGMKFMSALIETAIQSADKVLVKSIGGNHSFDNEYIFMKWVEERFPQAEVEVTNNYRTAYMLDNVLIFIQHGDIAKKNVELLLATEYPMFWGMKSTAEIHRGHYHTEKITETYGVIVRQFGTPKKADPYEKKNGYVGNKKELVVLEYDSNKLKTEYHI